MDQAVSEFGRAGGSSRGDELDVAEFHKAIKWAGREPIPLWPPVAEWICLVGWMLQSELDMVNTGSSRVDAIGIGSG